MRKFIGQVRPFLAARFLVMPELSGFLLFPLSTPLPLYYRDYGMIRCIDEVRERVRQNTGLSPTDAQIEQVLVGRPCSLDETVRGLIREQGRLYTERLLSAVLEAGFDYHALPVVMMGSGASVVSRHVRLSDGLCRMVTLLDDCVNAQGYERAVAALWDDDAQG